DVVGIAESERGQLIVLRRSRGRFTWLFFRSLWLAIRFLGSHRRAVGRWRVGARSLTSRQFWMEYLQWQSCSSEQRPVGTGLHNRCLSVTAQRIDCGLNRGNNEQTQDSLLQLG